MTFLWFSHLSDDFFLHSIVGCFSFAWPKTSVSSKILSNALFSLLFHVFIIIYLHVYDATRIIALAQEYLCLIVSGTESFVCISENSNLTTNPVIIIFPFRSAPTRYHSEWQYAINQELWMPCSLPPLPSPHPFLFSQDAFNLSLWHLSHTSVI